MSSSRSSSGNRGGYGGQNRGGFSGDRGGQGRDLGGGRGAPSAGSFPLRQLQKSARIVNEKYADNFPKISKWIDAEAAPDSFKPPKCQGIGTLKQKTLSIETNHVGIQIEFPDRIYHYEIVVKYGEKQKDFRPQVETEIKPKLWQKIVKSGLKLVEERHEKLSGRPIAIASDYSKALYTDKPLSGIDENYILSSNELDSTNTFVISVNETKSVIETKVLSKIINNMRGQELVNIAEIEQIYNIVLKTLPLIRFVNVGRAGFFNPLAVDGFHLGGGLVNVAGISLICTFGWKPFLNVDVANSVFVKGGKVVELLDTLFREERFRGDPSNVDSWDCNVAPRATELLKGCQVTYVFNGKSTTRRVTEVLGLSPKSQQFNVDGKETNVSSYFLSKGLKLEKPNGPCLVLGNNQSVVPAEICKVERGHHYSKRLTDRQTAAMITDTAKPPVERRKRILDSIKSCKFELDRVLKEFGVVRFGEGKGSDHLLSFDQCRILPAPSIHYGKNGEKQISPTNGVWNIFDYEFKFVVGAEVERWQILNLTGKAHDTSELMIFVDQLTRMANDAGLKLPRFSGMETLDYRNNRAFDSGLAGYFQNLDQGKQFQKNAFVLVIIPSKNHDSYGKVKKLAELDTGILTQCVAEVNVRKCQKATLGNIVLKLNAKLGGVDHFVNMRNGLSNSQSPIDFLTCPTLYIGADVTHPAANSLMPSVAAVTACYDRYAMKYSMHPQVQKRADKNAAEVIEGLDVIVSKMINNFKFVTKAIPRKIIYFRDGVGDGQYAEVLEKELGALRKACYMASGGTTYRPQITFISVQKRHKTRFFVKNSSDGIGKSGNCPPGAVVDTEIVHPTEMDFYLLSHQGIQGTSRPTRYHLLWDDSEFTADEIQMLTYSMCHSYSRCTRAVSIPAPTYYAHLAAYRVRCQIEAMPSSMHTDLKKLNERITRDASLTENFPMHFI